jgi:hypothetical protein
MRPRTQFANFPKYKYKVSEIQGFQNTSFLRTSTYTNAFQASEVLQPYFKSSKGISRTSLRRGVLTGFAVKIFFPTIRSTQESKGFILMSYIRGQLSRVLNQEFLFFGSRVAVFTNNPSHSWAFYSTRKPCAKAVPETDYFTQQKQYHKRTTLCTWMSQSQERDAEWSAPTITSTALLCCWGRSRSKIWRPLWLTLRCMPYGRGTLKIPLWRNS